jgi:hypothetical protein
MADIQKVIQGVDKVGAFANKYNSSIKEHIVSATLDSSTSILTLGKYDTDSLLVNLSQLNVITGLTFSQISTIKDNNTLQIGKYYELSFNTIDCIDNTDTVYTGATETLYLLATSVNTFHHQVFSKQYPQDIIYYDINNKWFDTHISSVRYDRNGYIYYRKDVIKNLEVDGYDFRTHIMKRYLVDSTSYNQYSVGTLYYIGSYVWYSGELYVCSVAHTSTSTFNDFYWIKILNNYYYNLPKTGSTTYGNVTIYASSTGMTGYTFSTTSVIPSTVYNISISCYKNYDNSLSVYTSSNYTHKPNIVIWGSNCFNLKFDQNCYDIRIDNVNYENSFIGSGNIHMIGNNYTYNIVNTNGILVYGSYTGINNLSNSYNLFISNGSYTNTIRDSNGINIFGNNSIINNCSKLNLLDSGGNNISYSSSLYLYMSYSNNIIKSSAIKLIGNSNTINDCSDLYLSYNTTGGTMNSTINSTFISSNFLYVTGSGSTNSYNQFTECSTINFNGSNNDLKSCGTIGSLFNINGSGNTLSNSNVINLTGSTNTLSACSYINLTGSQNNFYYCNAFGQRSGNFNSTQSNYNNNCNYFDTVGTGSFTNVNFTNSSANVWVLSGQTLSKSNFDGYVTNICFSGSTIQFFQNISFNTTLQGSVIGGTLYNSAGVITNTTINDKSFVGLNESSQPIAISFSGGTTPYYTNITAFA